MDLGHIKRNLEKNKYSTVHEVAADIKLVWKNCMTYNADGSDFYKLAKKLSNSFEAKFAKIAKDGGGGGGDDTTNGGTSTSTAANSSEPTLEEKRTFVKGLYKVSKEELGKVITELDTKCPAALSKNNAEDEIEINVDNITPLVFHEVKGFVASCSGGGGSGGGGGNGDGKKKKAPSSSSSTTGGPKAKKARA
eukprot:scaffold22759_cov54-Attheya_sp.AAC.2